MAGSTNGKLMELASEADRVPTTKLIQPAAQSFWRRERFAGFTPEQLSSLIAGVERGDTEKWVDLCSHMRRSDAVVRSAAETRVLGVSGAKFEITPGRAAPGQEEIAKLGAEFCRASLEMFPNLERTFAHLLDARNVGWSLAEAIWQRVNGAWHITSASQIHAKDVSFTDDWIVKVRTWDGGKSPKWIRLDEENPNRFIVHIPGGIGETPNLSGDFHAIVWPWLFKRWIQLFRQDALERLGMPMLIGTVAANAHETARQALFDALENLSGGHTGIKEDGTLIELLETARSPGASFDDAIEKLDSDIVKGILGSTLNVEVGKTGGNRALGESQADTTILPRLQADAKLLASTIERDWLTPLMKFNAHLFNGVQPPTPKFEFQLEAEERPNVDEVAIDAGVVTIDELRISRGLEPWGPEKGGDKKLEPFIEPSPEMFSRLGGGEQDTPFARLRRPSRRPKRMFFSRQPGEQLPLPLTTKTSATLSDYQSQILGALGSSLDDLES